MPSAIESCFVAVYSRGSPFFGRAKYLEIIPQIPSYVINWPSFGSLAGNECEEDSGVVGIAARSVAGHLNRYSRQGS